MEEVSLLKFLARKAKKISKNAHNLYNFITVSRMILFKHRHIQKISSKVMEDNQRKMYET